jgi:phage regulator Rha-like protein
MNAIVTLTPADIDTTVNHEPRIEDLKLAEALGFANLPMIRKLIERNKAALSGFGEVFSKRKEPTAKGGRPGRTFYLNRKQALFITAKSDTERAAHVTVQMVEVFDAVTQGREVGVKAHKRRISPARQSVASLRAEIEELRKTIAETRALTVRTPALPAATRDRMPGPFEPGSDVLKDLILAVYSAKQRVKLEGWTDFGEALTDTLADLRAMRDGRRPRGKVYDWADRRNGFVPPDHAGHRDTVN